MGRKGLSILALLLAAALLAAEPPVAPVPSPDTTDEQGLSLQERVRRRLPHRFERLRRTYKVDDRRLREQFDAAVEVLIRLQQEEIQVDAELQREIQQRRTQRRTPLGARDINDIEPSHIPAVEVLRAPLS